MARASRTVAQPLAVRSELKARFRTDKRCEESSCRDRSASVAEDEVEPPDRAEIGRAAWRYLHALAAQSPLKASGSEASRAQDWLAAFVETYPCSHCASHFLEVCEQMPPQTRSRRDFSVEASKRAFAMSFGMLLPWFSVLSRLLRRC